MGTRSGAAVLVMLLASMGPTSAVVGQMDAPEDGALGAVMPGTEVAGWVADGEGRAGRRFVHGPVETIQDGASFTWADEPLPMLEGQGIAITGADRWHRAGGTGSGVKVAVVDLGFAGHRSLLGGELPSSIRARSFRSDGDLEAGSSHGTAAAEIVHEIAPGAELYLVNYDYDLDSVVDYLIANEIDVVSFSVGYLSGPFDGTSPVADSVQRAIDAGIVWVTAAGNYARRHWGTSRVAAGGDGWVEIAENDRINDFEVAAGAEFHLYLSWLGDADLDLCLYAMPARADDPLACAAGVQSSGSRPLEVARWRNDGGAARRYGFAVRSRRGTAERIDVFGWNVTSLEHGDADHSIVVPGDVAQAITVGAVPWASPDRAARFSSRGPTADGRLKPDLVAPSGVSTRSAGAFVGTSAAAPHVAGLAALMLAAYPATPPDGLGDLLAARSSPLGADRVYGSGLARAGMRHPSCFGLAPTVVGTVGDDRLAGTSGPDVIHGRGGEDVIAGYGGGDVVCAGPGDDVVRGGDGNDRLRGNRGDDRVFGAEGRDRVGGGPGDDRVAGGPGDDRVFGGRGVDLLWGGEGEDRCRGEGVTGCEASGVRMASE